MSASSGPVRASASSSPEPPAIASPGVPAAADAELEATAQAAIRAGDHDRAISALMRAYGAAVYTRACRIVGDRQAAKDVLQQTFFEAHRDLARYDGRSSLKTWLLGIASHRALDAVRARRRTEQRTVDDAELPAIADDAAVDPRALVDRARRLRALEECLAKLSPEARAAVLLRFQQAMSYEAIAEATGDRAVTLHTRVTRALPVLRRCLERRGMTP